MIPPPTPPPAKPQPVLRQIRQILNHPVARNAMILLCGQIPQYILPFITLPYLTRILTTAKFGELAFAHSFLQYFVTLTEFGFSLSATRYIAIHRTDTERINRYSSAVVSVKLILLAISFLSVLALVATVPQLGRDPWVVYLTFFNVAGAALFPGWLYQGLEKMQYILYRDVAIRVVGVAGVFLFVRRAEDYLLVPLVQFGPVFVMALASLLTVGKACGVRLRPVSVREVRAAFMESLPLFLSQSVILLYTTSNTFILGLLAPPDRVAMFSVAHRSVLAVKSLIYPLIGALYPHVSFKASRSRADAVKVVHFAVSRVAWVFALFSAGLAAAAPIAVPLFFGQHYRPAIILLQVMAPIPLVVFLSSCYTTQYMLGLGYRRQWSWLIAATAVFNFVVLALLLLFLETATAVSITVLLVETFLLAGSYWFYRKTHANE